MPAPILLRLAAVAPILALAEASGRSWLTDDEATRLSAMGAPHRRRQLLAGHWLVRSLAVQAHGGDLAAWRWSRPEGQPAFLQHEGDIVFASISHSGDWLACAIAEDAIGLDVEASVKPRDFHALAVQVFSPEECALLRAGDGDPAAAFHRLWTIKEACGKRLGHGLRPQESRRQVPVAVPAGESCDVETWQGGGIAVALAHSGRAAINGEGLPSDTRHARWRIRVPD